MSSRPVLTESTEKDEIHSDLTILPIRSKRAGAPPPPAWLTASLLASSPSATVAVVSTSSVLDALPNLTLDTELTLDVLKKIFGDQFVTFPMRFREALEYNDVDTLRGMLTPGDEDDANVSKRLDRLFNYEIVTGRGRHQRREKPLQVTCVNEIRMRLEYLGVRLRLREEDARKTEETETTKKRAMPPKLLVVMDLDDTMTTYRRRDEKYVESPEAFWVWGYHVLPRPGLKSFLEWASERFDLAVYSAAHRDYVMGVVEKIDPDARFFPRDRVLGIDACSEMGKVNTKDLTKFGRDLSRVVLVDNSAYPFLPHPRNGIPIKDFIWNDATDRALTTLQKFLATLEDVPDVRPVLKSTFDLENRIEAMTIEKMREPLDLNF